MIESVNGECKCEVFSNTHGTTKAIVCSCGFAVSYTVLSNYADHYGMMVFNKRHAQQKERIARTKQYAALMELACADVIFFHEEGRPFTTTDPMNRQPQVEFSILVSDVFAPAADSEKFNLDDAIPLRDIYRKDGIEGIIRWVQIKRDNKPLRPHVEKRVKEREDLRTENHRLRSEKLVVTQREWETALLMREENENIGTLEALNKVLLSRK